MDPQITELSILLSVLVLILIAVLGYRRLGLYLAKSVGRMGGTRLGVRKINKSLTDILNITKETRMAQDDLNQQVTNLNTNLDAINTGVATLKTQNDTVVAELAAVKEQLSTSEGTADVDLSGLEAAVAKSKATADSFQTIPPVEVPTEPTEPTEPSEEV